MDFSAWFGKFHAMTSGERVSEEVGIISTFTIRPQGRFQAGDAAQRAANTNHLPINPEVLELQYSLDNVCKDNYKSIRSRSMLIQQTCSETEEKRSPRPKSHEICRYLPQRASTPGWTGSSALVELSREQSLAESATWVSAGFAFVNCSCVFRNEKSLTSEWINASKHKSTELGKLDTKYA